MITGFENSILIDEEFVNTFNLLVLLALGKDFRNLDVESPSNQELQRLVWKASILALSTNERYRNVSNAVGALLFKISNINDADVSDLGLILASRSGNTPVSENMLKKLGREVGAASSIEIAGNKLLNMIVFESDSVSVWGTSFQKTLYESMFKERKALSISAPTSAGKSFLIQKYLKEKVISKLYSNVLYIVPTKSLIQQVANTLKKEFNLYPKVHIFTHFDEETERFENEQYIYVLTQERCLAFFSSNSYPVFDLIFVDEIQNVSDGKRGVILEYVLKKCFSFWPGARFISAGPYLEKSESIFQEFSMQEILPVSTGFEPVFQVKIRISFNKNSTLASVSVFTPFEKIHSTQINFKKKYYSKFKSSPAELLSDFLVPFRDKGLTLAYCPLPSQAEGRAKALSKDLGEAVILDKELSDFIEFVADEIHQSYELITCLKTKTSFHHSGLPELVRSEMEYLIEKGTLDFVFCTSTLLEGVNFPASRMIVLAAKSKYQPMTQFDFKNLSGRAGRISSNYIGYLYCLETKEEAWAEDYLSNKTQKRVSFATNKVLDNYRDRMPSFIENEFISFIHDIPSEDRLSLKNTVIMIRSMSLTDPEALDSLFIKKIGQNEFFKNINESLENYRKKITVSVDILKQNPFVDPTLIQRLYEWIINDGYSKWAVTNRISKKEKTTKAEERAVPFLEKSFYFQFEYICEKLESCFNITSDMTSDSNFNDKTMRSIVRLAHMWLSGNSLKNIISIEIDSDIAKAKRKNEKAKEVDAIIANTTKTINSDICFNLVKYLGVLTSILSELIPEEEQDKYKLALALPSMLESGSMDKNSLTFMSYGIPRTISLFLGRKIPKDFEGNHLLEIKKIPTSSIPVIYLRYLRRYDFI